MTLWFDDLHEGQVFETGERLVTQDDIDAFAALSGDRNRIHGDGLAHGVLVMGIAGGLLHDLGHFGETTVALLDVREWRFAAPVRAGDSVRARVTIRSLRRTSRGDRGVVVRRTEVLNQRGELVQEGETTVLLRAAGH